MSGVSRWRDQGTWSALSRRLAVRRHLMPPSLKCSMMPVAGGWLRCANGGG